MENVKATMEVPISTYHRGALLVGLLVMCVIVLGLPTQSAVAQPRVEVTQPPRSSATEGVRTETAIRLPQPAAPARKPSVSRRLSPRVLPKRTVMPPEGSNTGQYGSAIARATALVGARYRYGGVSPTTGFDCTGFVRYVFAGQADYLPRSAAGMYQAIHKVDTMQPGDILFFGRGHVRHAALYLGNGRVVHASTPSRGVTIDSVDMLTRSLGFVGVGRI